MEAIKLTDKRDKLREHQQKIFVMLSRFWPLRGWGV